MPSPTGRRFFVQHGFTLLELVISILVVAIMATMLFPVVASVQSRVERGKCTANLRSLHVAANLYVQDHHVWPQVAVTKDMEASVSAGLWLDVLKPYGLEQINWLCPTVQRLLGGPDMSDSENKRIDYMASPFGTNPQAPFQYVNQPWFVESGNVHGNGNLIIFPDGHVESLNEFLVRVVPRDK